MTSSWPRLGEVVGDEMGRGERQLGADRRLARLPVGEHGLRVDRPGLGGRRVGDGEAQQPCLLGEHHAERAVVALLGPAHVAGVGDVAQRDDDLHRRPQRCGGDHPPALERRTGRPNARIPDRWPPRWEDGPEAAQIGNGEAPGPIGSEEDRRGGDHHPREHADGEEPPRQHVEHHEGDVGERARSPPQQPADDRQVEDGAQPTGDEPDGGFVECRSDDGGAGPRCQPRRHRLTAEQPVGVELGQPGHHVDDADLQPQDPHDEHRDRRPAARRQHSEEDERQRDEPVVVEVQGGVDQLAVRERQHEPGGGQTRAPPGRHSESEGDHRHYDGVHQRPGQRPHPGEPRVRQVMSRSEIQRIDPALGQEASRAEGAEQPHRHAEERHGRRVDLAPRTVVRWLGHRCPLGLSRRCRRQHRRNRS